MTETWDGDRLGFKQVGATFTKLVQSVGVAEPGSKVISIEAGFGRGTPFFRENWAKDLKAAGEVVVEIDARQSDHSGDPVMTFIGPLKMPVAKLAEWPDTATAAKGGFEPNPPKYCSVAKGSFRSCIQILLYSKNTIYKIHDQSRHSLSSPIGPNAPRHS